MAKSIKISDEEMDLLRAEAEMSSRSLAGQMVHWMRIGRSIERSRFFTYARIRSALNGDLSPDALTLEEQEVYIDGLLDATTDATPEQDAFFAERRKKRLGVGLDRKGQIAHASSSDS